MDVSDLIIWLVDRFMLPATVFSHTVIIVYELALLTF